MKKKVHFIGICGKGMSALAIMMKQTGWAISGSDEGFYNPGVIYDLLKKHKINFNEKYAKGNIPKDTILIVIGKHAKLVPETNDEVKEAFASGIKIQSMPQALGDLAL
ncbi:MAG: Mur ligase domain-containing protein, partial [Patescibacteria group bacterium]